MVSHPLPHPRRLPLHLSLFSWLTTNTVLCCHQPPPWASCWDGACSFIYLVACSVSVSCMCRVCQASWVLQLQLTALGFSYNAGDIGPVQKGPDEKLLAGSVTLVQNALSPFSLHATFWPETRASSLSSHGLPVLPSLGVSPAAV